MNVEQLDGLDLMDTPEFMGALVIKSEGHFHKLKRTDPDFPKPITRGRRYTRYVRAEVKAYLAKLIQRRDEELARKKAA